MPAECAGLSNETTTLTDDDDGEATETSYFSSAESILDSLFRWDQVAETTPCMCAHVRAPLPLTPLQCREPTIVDRDCSSLADCAIFEVYWWAPRHANTQSYASKTFVTFKTYKLF